MYNNIVRVQFNSCVEIVVSLCQSDVRFMNFGVPLFKRFMPSHMRTVESSVAAYKWC